MSRWTSIFSDGFSADTIANYTFDAGTGTIAVSGGVLVPSDTTEKRMFPTGYSCANGRMTYKFRTGAGAPSVNQSALIKRIDVNNFIIIHYSADQHLYIYKYESGFSSLAFSGGTLAPATNTNYWLRGTAFQNVLTTEIFTSAPTPTSVADLSLSHTLTGANATKFGIGIPGNLGLRVQDGGDFTYDDFNVEIPVSDLSLAGVGSS